MYNEGDYVVYNKDVCCVKKITKLYNKDYYVIIPVDDESLKINVPVEDKAGSLRSIISKEDALKLIEKIPSIEALDIDEKMIEREYKTLLSTNEKEDLIKIIKTAYGRNEQRLNNKKKIGEKDDFYFKRAEKILYNELSFSLGKDYDETRSFVISKVESLAS